MKTIINYTCALLLLFSISACEEVIFIPVQGSIQGVITDNNGMPLQGVNVTAAYEAPSQQPFESTKTVSTDANGFFQINDLWDKVALNASLSGFKPGSALVDLADDSKPVVDFVLEGSPSITDIRLDKNSLSASEADTLSIVVEVQDKFNDNTGSYIANIIVQTGDGATQTISNMSVQGQGLEVLLFKGTILSTGLASGTYLLIIEVRDPDGNRHQSEGGSFLIE